MIPDPTAFIRANTRWQAVPHAPSISLWTADEVTPIWRLTEEELGRMGLPPPFWAFAWAGGQALARWLLDNPGEVAGKRVLDVATGSGLVAVAAMRAGAATATGNDIDPFAGAAVVLNAEGNGVEVGFVGDDLLDGPVPDVEVVTLGDLAYERPLAARVRRFLDRCHAAGVRVLIGDPGRTYFDATGLVRLADYRVETTRELEDQAVKRTGVWTHA